MTAYSDDDFGFCTPGQYEKFEPYDVMCDRCGVTLSCTDAYVEEGDEWECEGCNIRCDAIEYYDWKGLDIDFGKWDVDAEVAAVAILRFLLKG